MERFVMEKKFRIKRTGIIVFIFAAAMFLLSGCTSEKDPVEITFIHGFGSSDKEHQAMRQIYKDFEKEHPEIHINMISMPSSEDVISKTRDLLTVGEVPDLIFTAGDGRESVYRYMVENEDAVDLMPYIENDPEFLEKISPRILKHWTTDDGGLYTVSDVLLMSGYWYNRDLFLEAGISEIPKTWEQFEEACGKLKKTTGNASMILDSGAMVRLTHVMLREEGENEITNIKNDQLDLQSPEFANLIERFERLIPFTELADEYNYRDSLEAFNQEETAIYFNGVWASTMIDETINVGYAAFPSENGESVSMVSACVGYIVGNSKDEERINASIEFLKYMLDESTAERLYQETGQIPSNPNIVMEEEIIGERLSQAVNTVLNADRIIEEPANEWSDELRETYGKKILRYFLENDQQDLF